MHVLVSVCGWSQTKLPLSIQYHPCSSWEGTCKRNHFILFPSLPETLILFHPDCSRDPPTKNPTFGKQWVLSSVYCVLESVSPGLANVFKMKACFSTLFISPCSCFHLLFAFKFPTNVLVLQCMSLTVLERREVFFSKAKV